MANTNVTRVGNTHEKKAICMMVAAINDETRKEFPAAGNYQVGNLPPNGVIQNAYVWTTTVAGAPAAVTVGITEGGTEILSAGDADVAGDSGTFTGLSGTSTGRPVFVNLATIPAVGEFNIVIEYVELTLNTGALTKVG